MEFLEDGQVLKVKSVRLRDQGLYQCLASNNAGTQMRQFRLTVQGLFFSADTLMTSLPPHCVVYEHIYSGGIFVSSEENVL